MAKYARLMKALRVLNDKLCTWFQHDVYVMPLFYAWIVI